VHYGKVATTRSTLSSDLAKVVTQSRALKRVSKYVTSQSVSRC